MQRLHTKPGKIGLVLAAATLFACSKNDAGTGDTGLAIGVDTGMSMSGMSDTGIVASASGLSDANIFYILDQSNALDSAGGAIAVTKGTNAEVREFGGMMVRDHHALREQGQNLARKLAITPEAPVNDNSRAEMDRTMAMLNGAGKGRDFDRAYMDDQVTYHINLLQTATTAMAAAQNADLKNFIQKAAPSVQAHLDRAKAIQSKLK